jgi:NAD(P)-dependent dehydrogenase (short-subunit alcohol dehydrogenase family)
MAIKKFGHLDVVGNNATFQRTYDNPSDISEGELDQTFRTNIYGPFFLSQASLDHLEEGGPTPARFKRLIQVKKSL